MGSTKIERKNNKKIVKKLTKKMDESPLNPFIKHYYLSLKECELNSNKESVIDKIKYNNKLINKLRKEIFSSKICDIHKEIVNNYISDLDYENETNKEIIKFLDVRKQEFLYRKKLIKCNKIFKKNNKLSETI